MKLNYSIGTIIYIRLSEQYLLIESDESIGIEISDR